MGSRIPHEVRTTWLPGLLSYEDMLEVAALVRGSALWAVQRFVSSKALDPAVLGRPAPTAGDLARLRAAAEALGVHCVTR